MLKFQKKGKNCKQKVMNSYALSLLFFRGTITCILTSLKSPNGCYDYLSSYPNQRQDSILTFHWIHLAMQYKHSLKISWDNNDFHFVISSASFISVFILTTYLTCFLFSCYNLISFLFYTTPHPLHTQTYTCSHTQCTHIE